MSLLLVTALLAAVVGVLPAPAAHAAQGDLDPTFGDQGKVTTDFRGGTEGADDVAIQADGKILAAGGGDVNFALARYDVHGSLDTTFDGDGRVTTNFGPGSAYASALAIQADGKIVAAGQRYGLNYDFALARYNPDGSLDTTFGTDGKVITQVGNDNEVASAVTVQADGKIVAVGSSIMLPDPNRHWSGHFTAIRYHPDGSLDTTFDGDGKVTTDIGPGDDFASDVGIQADGRIVLVGSGYDLTLGNPVFTAVRYNLDGSLDTTFDGDGKLTTTVSTGSPFDVAHAMTVQPDGRILAAGKAASSAPGGHGDFALVRYNTNGSLDTTFDGDGKVMTPIGPTADDAYDVAVQADGKIIAVGDTALSGASRFAVVRYNPDGSLDPGFGIDGKVTTAVGTGSYSRAMAVAIQADGKIVAAGYDEADFALVRYVSSAAPATFMPVAPARVLDTRNGTGQGGRAAKLGPNQTRVVNVTGSGGVPDTGVVAAVVNVTVTEPSSASFLSVTPNGGNTTSNVNFKAGQDVANLVTVPVGSGGNVRVYNASGSTHVLFDVVGWYADPTEPVQGARHTALAPARILDTRNGTGRPDGAAGKVGPDQEIALDVTGVGGVPADARVSAVTMNLTATEPSSASFLSVTPNGGHATSNLNFRAGQDVPNLVTVPVGPDGKVRIYNAAGSTHALADVMGWYSAPEVAPGTRFTPVAPARILDTRLGVGRGGVVRKVGNNQTISVDVTGRASVPSSGVSAVVVNVTATEPTTRSFLSITPNGGIATSNLNFVTNQDVPNLVVVPVAGDGNVRAYNAAGATHVIFDVVGFFSG